MSIEKAAAAMSHTWRGLPGPTARGGSGFSAKTADCGHAAAISLWPQGAPRKPMDSFF